MIKKADLVAKIAERTELSKKKANEVLDIIVEVISEVLKEGESVQLAGLGSLSVGERAARVGHNPQTGEKLNIAASKVVRFKQSSKIKAALNEAKKPAAKKTAKAKK